MIRALLTAIAILCVALAVQTWRLDRAGDKSKRLDTCEEVQSINREIRNETDDDLLDRVSRPQ